MHNKLQKGCCSYNCSMDTWWDTTGSKVDSQGHDTAEPDNDTEDNMWDMERNMLEPKQR